MDEAELDGARRGEALAGQEEPHRLLDAELADAEDGDHRRDDADADLAEGEQRRVGGDRQVARRNQTDAAAEGVAVDAPDDGLRRLPDRPQHLDERMVGGADAPALQVRAGAERGPGAGEDDGPHLRRGERRGEVLAELGDQRIGERVPPLGLVERDPGGVAAQLVERGGHQTWRILATTCFITSSAPPPMLISRESTKARAAGFSQQ